MVTGMVMISSAVNCSAMPTPMDNVTSCSAVMSTQNLSATMALPWQSARGL